jgi:glycosyltransferase involved in cell wall biosynthesis
MHPFSVIIPAFNEARFLPATLAAVRRAEDFLGEPVEIIVADNESTDATAAVAREFGARVITVDIHCIAAVRNRGAAAATGRYLVFCDADNCMSPNMLDAIRRKMDTGQYVGGGITHARYDRESRGIRLTHGLVNLGVRASGLSMFLFYTTPEAFWGAGGFDETRLSAEDFEFAKRLRGYGKSQGLRYANLAEGELVMSARKFTEYGDWAIFRYPITFLKACFNDPDTAYELWYNPAKRG